MVIGYLAANTLHSKGKSVMLTNHSFVDPVIFRVLCTNWHDLHLNLYYWILRHTASSIQNQA